MSNISFSLSNAIVFIICVCIGSSSTQSWGRGHGRRGPTRGVTESRLEDGSRWNVKVIGGTGVGERGVNFVSKMGTVIRVHCKLWDDNFVKLPETTKDAIFRDLQVTFHLLFNVLLYIQSNVITMCSCVTSGSGLLRRTDR